MRAGMHPPNERAVLRGGWAHPSPAREGIHVRGGRSARGRTAQALERLVRSPLDVPAALLHGSHRTGLQEGRRSPVAERALAPERVARSFDGARCAATLCGGSQRLCGQGRTAQL